MIVILKRSYQFLIKKLWLDEFEFLDHNSIFCLKIHNSIQFKSRYWSWCWESAIYASCRNLVFYSIQFSEKNLNQNVLRKFDFCVKISITAFCSRLIWILLLKISYQSIKKPLIWWIGVSGKFRSGFESNDIEKIRFLCRNFDVKLQISYLFLIQKSWFDEC